MLTYFNPSTGALINRKDPYYARTMFQLSSAKSTTGSSTFIDRSPGNFPITAAGGVTFSNEVSKFGSNSIKFSGSGTYLHSKRVASQDRYNFTVEFWFYRTGHVAGSGNPAVLVDTRSDTSSSANPFIAINSSGTIAGNVFSSARWTSTATNLNQWYHVAVSRDGTTWRMFLNGVQVGSNYTSSAEILPHNDVTIGTYVNQRTNNTSYKFAGYIDDVRIISSAYTSNFTPATRLNGITGDYVSNLEYRGFTQRRGSEHILAGSSVAQAGDLALLYASVYSNVTITMPTGWTESFADVSAPSLRYRIGFKIITAEDIGASIPVIAGGTNPSTIVHYLRPTRPITRVYTRSAANWQGDVAAGSISFSRTNANSEFTFNGGSIITGMAGSSNDFTTYTASPAFDHTASTVTSGNLAAGLTIKPRTAPQTMSMTDQGNNLMALGMLFVT
jgi:hypothetical protein